MDLQRFQSQFTWGFQQDNYFTCRIFPHDPLLSRLTGAANPKRELVKVAVDWFKQGLLCDSTRLPDRSFDQVPMTQYGVTEQFPVKSEYTALDCTFLIPLWGADNPVHQFFVSWQNTIQNFSTGLRESTRDFTFPENYYADIITTTFDRFGMPTLAYKFERAYPKTLESTPVNWDTQSELAKVTVAFNYTCWSLTDEKAPSFTELDPTWPIPVTSTRPFETGSDRGFGWPFPFPTIRVRF